MAATFDSKERIDASIESLLNMKTMFDTHSPPQSIDVKIDWLMLSMQVLLMAELRRTDR